MEERSSTVQMLLPIFFILGLIGTFILGIYYIFIGISLDDILFDQQLQQRFTGEEQLEHNQPVRIYVPRRVVAGEQFNVSVDYNVYSVGRAESDWSGSESYAEEVISIERYRDIDRVEIDVLDLAISGNDLSCEGEILRPRLIPLCCEGDSCSALEEVIVGDILRLKPRRGDNIYYKVTANTSTEIEEQGYTLLINYSASDSGTSPTRKIYSRLYQ